jgi:hypothetical protein
VTTLKPDEDLAPAEASPRSGASRSLADWVAVGVFALVPLLLIRQVLKPIEDPDTYWHLRAGQYLLDTGAFSGPEPWSRYAENPFVLHEWAEEVLFVAVERVAGPAGLIVIQALVPVMLLIVLYAVARRWAGTLVSALVAVTAWVGASAALGARPQAVSFLFLAVTAGAWVATSFDHRARWWLVPLTWAWACTHGLWILGPVIGLTVTAGMLCEDPRGWRRLRSQAAIVLLSVVAAALTPAGPKLVLIPGSMTEYAQFVTEWATPSPTTAYSAATLLLACCIALIWAKGPRRPTWPELFLWLLAVAATLMYTRTVAIGAIVLTPLAARALAPLASRSVGVSRRAEAATIGAGFVAFAAVVALLAPSVATRPIPYPTGLDRALSELPSGTGVLNEYRLGGWLLWNHPDLDPYVDGRADVYSVAHLQKIYRVMDRAPGWYEEVAEDGLGAALLREANPVADDLVSDHGWTVAGRDRSWVLLVPGPTE